ncbi:MAG: BolA/IbaG family iron-sulfur metabolism protein [Cyanobacteria bacterium HKST-UBA06]|nr:BolA/IbaG family iron-sulfur metabolism protein [Cyanobacteria bacterium HKST-UBA05]MCA9799713.1 BolA/IbaG family iron-sulfur metabolism protein [Cyanobacteria bacterium HKST-UBA04]MCA9807766.1 BolA/IbaG family iron-sulfur metabolism protein [Cyanobacteria bacterium HKST-UBA06]MCA9841262.1 BolA/IbaG family iron-sulfur metabolism protein [Cyanobacteria bacterium HKST-UBA03]
MISPTDLEALLKSGFNQADVALMDLTGAQNHYRLFISSPDFSGKPLIEQHRMVYQVLGDVLKDERLHAIEIKTDVPTPA